MARAIARALSARQRDASLAHQGVVALGHLRNELVGVRQFGCLNDLRARGFRPAVGDVLPDRRVKQQRLLNVIGVSMRFFLPRRVTFRTSGDEFHSLK